ncbi:Reverse transcriptase [Vibrio phage VHML]|uniref:ORF37 n=1 Tax=Vibrio phage VHML TaxID=207597 RepID=Q8H9M9_9CAUD|nr:Reverse transcriptase [Vibrio phage VHML]AAN12336.1 ORF37 [Vibrio phage VHML]
MRSLGCSFEKIFDFENLLSAAYSCRKGKTKANATLVFFNNLEENIIDTKRADVGRVQNVPLSPFYYSSRKRRLISAPHFKDRVVHRAIYNVIEPLFDKTYIYDSYACRRGERAPTKALTGLQYFIKKVESKHGKAYALKADISRYFSSIDHQVLKSILEAKIQCQRTLDLLFYIIDNSPCESMGVGIPLGNLTSQIFANVYLHELDRYAKHALGAKHYIRYMDDFAIIHHDKAVLHQWRKDIEEFLHLYLRLKTNSKTQVFPYQRVMAGAWISRVSNYSSHRLLRNAALSELRQNLKSIDLSC